jgi:hypothetical protein
MVQQFRVRTVLDHSNTSTACSNPARNMRVHPLRCPV